MVVETYHDILVDPPSMEQDRKEVIRNPALVFEHVMRDIEAAFTELRLRYGAFYEDFERHIKENSPHLFDELEENYSQIDTDIYARYKKGRLSKPVFDRWHDQLMEWQKAFLSAIKIYEMSLFKSLVDNSAATN
jgi:exopolyphosphatase/pppGpp-phosphohydrolase